MIMASKYISDLQVCQAYAEMERQKQASNYSDYEFAYDILARMTGLPAETVCFRAMERACGLGLVEYGVSLRTGWLTEEGKQLLEQN